MTFESLLSKRYIFAQKRHSLLTISSIAVAVTLMTLLFCGFTTYINCIAKGAPYHIMLDGGTPELTDYVKNYPGVKESYPEKLSDGTYEIRVFFDKSVVNPYDLIEDIRSLQEKEPEKLKLDGDKFSFTDNFMYMTVEMVGEAARIAMVQTFAIFYIVILFLAFALRMIIDTAFEVSAKEREKQFGVLQSVGASPKQIVRLITFEGLMLSAVGIPVGLILGIALTFLAFKVIAGTGVLETYVSDPKYIADLGVSVKPLMLAICAVTCLVWVLFSAYGTGMRIIKKSPIQAITERTNNIKKVRRHSLWGLLFGWTGKMATRNNHRQPKRYIITVLALTLSITLFTAFSVVLNTADRAVKKTFDSIGVDFSLDSTITDYTDAESMIEKIENTGYFKDCGCSLDFMFASDKIREKDQERSGYIKYVNRAQFETLTRLNSITPSVSYDDLLSSGKYLMLDYTDDIYPDGNSISGTVITFKEIDEEEYNKGKEKEEAGEEVKGTYNKSNKGSFFKREFPDISLDIAERIPSSSLMYYIRGCEFIAPVETYINKTRDTIGDVRWGVMFTMNLKDYKLHDRAVSWLDTSQHAVNDYKDPDNKKVTFYYEDFFNHRYKTSSTITAIKSALFIVSFLIAAIALVNLINIISTGIANRKSELASMMCLGMTPKQLYRMSFVESLQYVFCAGISSVLLCSLIVFAVRKMITGIFFDFDIDNSTYLSEMMVKYTEPIPTILIASAVALIAALITSFIPLHRMQKESLVDQIRSID